MVRPGQSGDEQPEELRRKLALLAGDTKAYFESSKTAIKQNAERITELRKENKALVTKVKTLKSMAPGAAFSNNIEHLDSLIADAIKRNNVLKHDKQRKDIQLKALDDKFKLLEIDEAAAEAFNGGESAEAQRLRELENSLDKAVIKSQEAQHIGGAYQQIIQKLQEERLQFENKITAMEDTIRARKQDLAGLERMYVDASLAREVARKELQQREKEMNEGRAARDAEKRALDALAEERRKQIEAIEKRLRLASATDQAAGENEEVSEESKALVTSYEDAMRKIQEATGVSDVQEVVNRFLVQGETQENLKRLQQENVDLLAKLRDEHARTTKEFETLKYSGEARNTSNQRMLAEFEQHLNEAKQKCTAAKETEARVTKLLVDVKTGIDHLYEKLERLKAVQYRAAVNVNDKLIESEHRLANLIQELADRKAELGGLNVSELPTAVVLPEHNTRIVIELGDKDTIDDSDSDDDDFISRDTIKRNVQSVLDSKTKKKKVSKKRGH